MSSEKDEGGRRITVDIESYSWADGEEPADGTYVAEFARFVETGGKGGEAAALFIYEDEEDRSDPFGRVILGTPDVPRLAPEGDERGGAFYVDLRDGRVTDVTFDEELTATRTSDLGAVVGDRDPSREADEAVTTELIDDLAARNDDE